MKKLSIPSAMVGLTFGLIATVFVYLFVPPPSTASADDCPTSVYAWNCAESCATSCATDCATDCATAGDVESIVSVWCS